MVESGSAQGHDVRAWRRHSTLVVVASYALLTIILTWPVARTFGTHVGGSGEDLNVALWDAWWFHHAVTHGKGLLTTPYLFYPHGVALNYHSISWSSAAIAFPFRVLFGAVAAYNTMLWAQTLLCGVAMYFCARYVVQHQLAAWLAGFVFAFEPVRFERSMVQPNLAGTGAVPLVLLGLLKAWREGRPVWSVFAAAALGCVLLTGAQLFIMTCVAVAYLGVWEALSGRYRERRFWVANSAFGAACIPFVGPWLWPYLRSSSSLSDAVNAVEVSELTSDPITFVLPWKEHPIFGRLVGGAYASLERGGTASYLGLLALALVVLACVSRLTRREALPWVVGLACFSGLSLGAHLRFAGSVYDVALLPYRALQDLLPIRAVRGPNRFNLLGGPFLAMAAAWGFVALAELLRTRQRLALVVLPLAIFDYLRVPYPTTRIVESRFYQRLARSNKSDAIVELPLKRSASKVAMLSQTIHGKPLVGGMVARLPRDAMEYIEASPLLRSFAQAKTLSCKDVRYRTELEHLRDDHISYFVLRRTRQKALPTYTTYFPGEPDFKDSELRVYSIASLLSHPLPCDDEPPPNPTTLETSGSFPR